MADHNLCVYCITKKASSINELHLKGVESRPVYFLSYGSLAVALSKVDWKEGSLSNLIKEPDWMDKRIKEHEAVNEEIMKSQAILPMKFLTLFKDENSLGNSLTPFLKELECYLEYIQDKEEWLLKVYCEESQALMHLLDTDIYLNNIENRMPRTVGEQYFYKKCKKEMVDQKLYCVLGDILREIYQALTPLTVDWVNLGLYDKKVTKGIREMLFKATFLVSKHVREVFTETVRHLNERYREWGFFFVLTGPWPPYNFCPNLEKAFKEEVSNER